MATSAAEIRSPPADAPEGTCEPVRDHAPWWFVRGRRGWYIVNALTGVCDCPAYVWRCSPVAGELCKHGRRLAQHLEALAACPACHGRRVVVPCGLIDYVTLDGKPDPGPWQCSWCGGSGKRSSEDVNPGTAPRRAAGPELPG
jgi:hypothetical protein